MQIARRLAEIHPDKLLDALEAHVADGHEQAALQAIPDLAQQHPQMAAELELIRARLSDKLSDEVVVLNRDSATIFRCANCGAGLSRQNPDSVKVICQYCGSDAEHPAAERDNWNHSLDLESRFTVGNMMELEGVRWQAVGVQLFSGTVLEWDGEDGKWERTGSRYTSWWLLNENRELAWLIDDGKKRYWAEKFIPSEPRVPEPSDKSCEHGDWSLEFAAGEFTYQPRLKGRHISAEYSERRSAGEKSSGRKGKYAISVESQLDDEGNVTEIEFFRSRQLTNKQILQALARGSEVKDVNRWRNTSRAFIVALPALLASFFYFDRGGTEETVRQQLDRSSVDVQLRSFDIAQAGTVLKFQAFVPSLPDNSWFGVNLEMEDSDGEPAYEKYVEFWRESGYDSDGRWSESDRRSSWFVRFDQPGTYTLSASAEAQSSAPAIGLGVKTQASKVSSTPFILAGFFSVFLILLARSKASSIASAAASLGLKLIPRRTATESAAASGSSAPMYTDNER